MVRGEFFYSLKNEEKGGPVCLSIYMLSVCLSVSLSASLSICRHISQGLKRHKNKSYFSGKKLLMALIFLQVFWLYFNCREVDLKNEFLLVR